jgi:uncharacterized RDD family membrane protein YckC
VTTAPRYGEPLVTGEAVAVEIRTAGIGSRAVAVVIDFALQFALLLLLVFFIDRIGTSMDSAGAVTFVLVSYVLLVLGYPVGFETLWQGRTPGKAALGLRVTRDDGGPIRFRHALVRGLVGVVVERPGLFFLPALLCMLINNRSKRLGDLAAGTIVVQERVPSRVVAPMAMPPPLAGWAATLDLTGIDDPLAWEVRQFLSRAEQLSPTVRDQMANRLVAAVSGRTAPPPPGAPAWAYLSAVLAERRRRELERVGPPGTPAPQAPVERDPAPPPPRGGGFVPPA